MSINSPEGNCHAGFNHPLNKQGSQNSEQQSEVCTRSKVSKLIVESLLQGVSEKPTV